MKSGDPYDSVPPIPTRKVGPAGARYSIMVITDSGRSRQIDLTPARVRMGIAGAVCVLVLAAAAGLFAGSYWAKGEFHQSERDGLLDRIKALEEQLQSKELALAVQKKRLEQLERGAPSAREAPAARETAPESDSALSEAPAPSEETHAAAQPEPAPRDREPWATAGSSGQSDSAPLFQPPLPDEPAKGETSEDAQRMASLRGESQPVAEPPVLINFNAEELVAAPKGDHTSTIRFRLTKDRPEARFTGYLFVYLEVKDRRGRNIVYVNPAGTDLGEGDLPIDYRQGKPISFQRHSQVALDYPDERRETDLTGVSILLYDESGQIVFQRGFERAEISSGRSKSRDVGGSPAGSQRRGRAL